jgi:hypothetical protein
MVNWKVRGMKLSRLDMNYDLSSLHPFKFMVVLPRRGDKCVFYIGAGEGGTPLAGLICPDRLSDRPVAAR